MNRATEQALTNLLPSLNSLPPELLNYALSLLSQSRIKASTLKAEEEAARVYACANLASERLRQKLRLPKIVPRPPCPPRIYRKLITHLDSVLATQTIRKDPLHPAGSHEASKLETNMDLESHVANRASEKGIQPRRNRLQAARVRSGNLHTNALEDDVMKANLPMIRKFCMIYNDRTAIPHVCAGVRSVLSLYAPNLSSTNPELLRHDDSALLTGRNHTTQIEEKDIPSVIFILLLLVRIRLGSMKIPNKLRLGVEEGKFFAAASKAGVCNEIGLGAAGFEASEKLWDVANEVWVKMDWFQNMHGIDSQSESQNAETVYHNELDKENWHEREDTSDQLDLVLISKTTASNRKRKADNDLQGILQPGLGTMFCPAVDFLSGERRARYQVWKHQVLDRIANMP